MFKVLNSINKENIVTIQGARYRDSNIPFATLLFQNFDNDTHETYNMCAVSAYDHHANEISNGAGDLVFRTKNLDSSNLQERMRVLHDGTVTIGNNIGDTTAMLTVGGDVVVNSNIQANELTVGRITATTSRIILRGSNVSDNLLNIHIDASNITGTYQQTAFPANVTFSNIFVTSNIQAPELTLGTLTATTSKILLKASNTKDNILNLHVDASNIRGTIPFSNIPSDISFSNITSSTVNTTLVNTTRLVFNGFSSSSNNSNNSTTLTLGSNSDTLYFFKDWTNWTPSFSNNINVSNAQFSLSRYCVLNNNVTIDFNVSFNALNSNLNNVSFTLPLGYTNQSNYSPQVIVNSSNGSFTLSRSCASSNNLTLIFQPLQIGSYDIAGQHCYVYV